MIRISEDRIREMEQSYPGITEQIERFDALDLPPCPMCGSTDTASVQVGIVGRTIHLAAATSKFHLIPNGNGKGIHFCNICKEQFGPSKRQENYTDDQTVSTQPIFMRPADNSWQAYRDWVLRLTSALTGREAEDHYTKEQWIRHASTFWSKADDSSEF